MADRFWVGGTGNWSDNTNHWSATSGGSPGASKPTSADNVYFDENSFTAAGQSVTVDETANCLDMDWTGATNTPTWAGISRLNVYGNFKLINAMTRTYTGTLYFSATAPGKTITMNGKTLGGRVYIADYGGGYTLQDDFITSETIYHNWGILDTNSKAVSCYTFNGNYTNERTLTLGASTVTCSNAFFLNTTGLTFDAGTSTIIMTGNSVGFYGGGLTYNNVRFSGTPTTVSGDNTFNTLTVDSGKTCKLSARTVQTISDLSADGATIQSATPGSAARLSCASGTITVKGATITDIVAEGGATFNAVDCVVDGVSDGWNIIKTGGFMTCRSKFW